ncbi:MAG: cytochrome c biogenesis protein CcsA [Candidatus Thermoplasmatota archaeon]|jgi:cytochrome c-type biogenesis protein CcmF
MSAWGMVPMAAFALVAGALATQSFAIWRSRDMQRAVSWMIIGAAGALWAAFFFLLTRFIVVDVSYEYVFQYTSTQVPLQYRIAGTWTGREGSLLLWTAYTATAAAILARRRLRDDVRARNWTLVFLLVILLAFLWAVVAQDTFAATSEFFLQGRPEGNGLNPTLRSPFILIHPPLMFLAYALTAVTASAMLAQSVVGGRAASHLNLPWSRVNWLLYTVAIGLGGIWAYYTLGFGGYWGWDPVEVANLLPWIALTVFLHAQVHHVKHGSYAVALPFLGLLPFVLTLFSAISTRSGLWFSVHAFTDPTSTFNPDAAGRFLAILDVEPIVAFYVGLLLATLLAGVALWGRRLAVTDQHLIRTSRVVAAIYGAMAAYALVDPVGALGLAFQAAQALPGPTALGLIGILFAVLVVPALPALTAPTPASEAKPARLTERNLLYASVVTLSLGLLLFTLFHFNTVNGWDRAFYDARFPWLITPVLVLLILLQGHAMTTTRGLAVLTAACLAVAAAAWLLAPSERGGAYLATLGIATLAVGIERLRRAMTAPSASKRWKLGGFLLWMAALLDLVFWVNPPSNVGYGAFTWHPVWPAQLIFGALSVLALLMAQRNLAGHAKGWQVYVLTAVLGGFYVSPILAVAAWILRRRDSAPDVKLSAAKARLNGVAMQGLHVAFVLGIVGFALSTYFTHEQTSTLATGDELAVGPYQLTFNGTLYSSEPLWADEIRPQFSVERGGRDLGSVGGMLYWEPQTASHFPLPVTRRAWDGDLYIDVQKVCVDGEGVDCSGGDWVEAYKTSPRIAPSQRIGAVQVNAIHLPGLALVWTAWALASYFMALRLAAQRHAAARPTVDPTPAARLAEESLV